MSGVVIENSRNRPSTGRSTHAAHADVLQLGVVENSILRAFAAGSRFLHASEGRDLGGDDAGIQSNDAVLDRLGYPPAAGQIAGVDIGGEPELRVVGHGDGLRL